MFDFLLLLLVLICFFVCATKGGKKTFDGAKGLAVFYSPECALAVQHTEHVIHERIKLQERRAWGFAALWVDGEQFKQFILP